MTWWQHILCLWLLMNMFAFWLLLGMGDAMPEHQFNYSKSSYTASAMVDLVLLTAIAFVVVIIMVLMG